MTPADAARAAGDGAETEGAETARTAKSAEAFRTISEAAEELDIPAHVLRFWETKFPHLNPLKRGGRRRYYRPADMALLRGIRRLLYDEGLTIKGLQKVFRERGPRFVAAAGEGAEPSAALAPEAEAAGPDAGPRTRPSRDRVARLHALADSLAALRDRLRA